jgi:hypothetical protein
MTYYAVINRILSTGGMCLGDCCFNMMAPETLVCCEIMCLIPGMTPVAACAMDRLEMPSGMGICLCHPGVHGMTLDTIVIVPAVVRLRGDVLFVADKAYDTLGDFRVIGNLNLLGGACSTHTRS